MTHHGVNEGLAVDYKNQIRRFRERNGLSQRDLAAVVGTSQQQIQRYETGSPVKFHMAVALAKALNTALAKLFPESKSVVQQVTKRGDQREALLDPEIDKSFLEAGIEVDPCEWTARVIVRAGDPQRPRLYPIHVSDKNRLARYLEWGYEGSIEAKQSDEEARFFVFDAGDRTVAVNMDHIILWQNCWDPPSMTVLSTTAKKNDEAENEDEFSNAVSVYLVGVREPIIFGVDSDNALEDELEDEEDELEEKDSFISFTDQDGEVIHLRVRDIAILEIARNVTDPEPLKEGEEESEGRRGTNPRRTSDATCQLSLVNHAGLRNVSGPAEHAILPTPGLQHLRFVQRAYCQAFHCAHEVFADFK
jgi:transcriptional regulator with XRE-family HTH domain